MGKGDRERSADAARQRERYRLARAAAASPPLPDADGDSTSGGGGGAGGDASDYDADMREALDASRFDVGARDVHDDAALLARLRRATELSLDEAARAERADAAEDDDLRAALRASAASASSDGADGADILRAMRSSRRVARRVAARARSRSDDEAIDYYTALSHSERDGAGARDTDGERDGAIARGTVGAGRARSRNNVGGGGAGRAGSVGRVGRAGARDVTGRAGARGVAGRVGGVRRARTDADDTDDAGEPRCAGARDDCSCAGHEGRVGHAGAADAGTPHDHGDDDERGHPAQRKALRRSRNEDTAGKRRRRETATATATAAVVDHDAVDVDPYLADPSYFRKTFNEDPRAALQFLHHCTGLSSFHDLFDLKFNAGVLGSDDAVIERLNATIDEVRRATDTVVGARARVLDEYHAKRNRDAPLLSCAACGIREFDVAENGYQRFALSRLKTFTYQFPRDADLVARIERAAAHRDPVAGVSYDKIFSSYSYGTTRYHLHPEFVDAASPSLIADEPSALLCPTCAKGADGGKLPARCIATCDFGDLRRVGIDGLYPLEWLAIATARTYMCVYKLSGANAGTGVAATLRGQCITFQQSAAPGAVANMLPARDVHERISVMFVGPRAQLETQLSKALPFGANFSPLTVLPTDDDGRDDYDTTWRAGFPWPEYAKPLRTHH